MTPVPPDCGSYTDHADGPFQPVVGRDAIRDVFFRECEDRLTELEEGLLAMHAVGAAPGLVDAAFRAVHSIKGGAGAFGLEALLRFAHGFETALDALRCGRLAAKPTVLEVMLRAADVLAKLVRAAQTGDVPDPERGRVVANELLALSSVMWAHDAFGPYRLPSVEPSPLDLFTGMAALQRPNAPVPKPTIRADLDRLDRLTGLVDELMLEQAALTVRLRQPGLGRPPGVAGSLDRLDRTARAIQASVLAIRAQPMRSILQRLPRLAREVAAKTGKQVCLVTEGDAMEVDCSIMEQLAGPLTHMVCNAIDHGLELPNQRLAAGKPGAGTVRIAVLQRSGRMVIEVADDGAGIDRSRIRDCAVAKGLFAPDRVLSDAECDDLIFMPGFSTASAITDISGRGVGMDVVRRSIQALDGRISIESQAGLGSTFTLSFPLSPRT